MVAPRNAPQFFQSNCDVNWLSAADQPAGVLSLGGGLFY
ncbi:hypothetical protein swp_4863 [Shewanella piezotolerans WP3]|uniref:Uncharacterized protein n=1 Tax=Shewanella piezotolerans (strain WP3 / JCM 13877) TaxID=225849 RepID=B8CV09_SHEPW|nr:hypothetical protein swp_4863 [Shewanella piezotolerans WP3]